MRNKHQEKEPFKPAFVPLTRQEVEVATSMSRSTIYAMINPDHPLHDPSFPKPLKFGAQAVRWRGDEINAWLLSRERTCSINEDE